MECCAKREKCLYMHSDFPCKFYYLGMTDHDRSTCKFAHGRPLNDQLRNILLKHLETAPKEILGDFRRINRDRAVYLLGLQHQKLLVEFGMVPAPAQEEEKETGMMDEQEKGGGGRRPSRWCEPSNNSNNVQEQNNANLLDDIEHRTSAMSLRSLKGIISSDQIARLVSIGVESVDQINQMTVAQLNEIGLSIGQIHEIQLNALQVDQKKTTIANDFDMRLPANRLNDPPQPFDVDMRRLPDIETPTDDSKSHHQNPAPSAYDYSQYVKDSHIGAYDDDEKPIEHSKDSEITTEPKIETRPNTIPLLPAVYDPLSALFPTSISNKIDLSSSVTQLIKESSPDPRDTDSNKSHPPTPTTFEFFNRPSDDSAVAPCSLDQLLPDKPSTILPIPSSTTNTYGIYNYSPNKQSSEDDLDKQPSFSPAPSYTPWASSSSSADKVVQPKTTINPGPATIDDDDDQQSNAAPDDDDDEDFAENDDDDNNNDDEPENQYRVADAIFANVTSFSSRDKDMRRLLPSADHFQADKFGHRDNGDIDLRLPFKPVMANYIPAKEIDASFGSHPLILYKVS